MRGLVLSANMGGTKANSMVEQGGVGVDYIFYHNASFPTREASFTPRMTSKIPKMLGWLLNPGYDFYIWMDVTFSMVRPDAVQWFLKNMDGHDALFFKHPWRSTIKSEAEFICEESKRNVILRNKVVGEELTAQVDRYYEDKQFTDNFLLAAGAFCYSSKLVENSEYNVMKEWFFEVCTKGIRDQLSLPYVLQKFNTNYRVIPDNLYKSPYIKRK